MPSLALHKMAYARWARLIAALTLVGTIIFAPQALSDKVESEAKVVEPAVKKSRRGICHERSTIAYIQTIYFEEFDSLEACLADGGRLPGVAPRASSAEPTITAPRSGRRFWTGLDAVYILAGSICAIGLIAGVMWRLWYRRLARRKLRAFERRQERAWQGHKLESKKPLERIK